MNSQSLESNINFEATFVNIVRTNANQKKCVICNRTRYKKGNNKLTRITDKTVVDAYIKTSILIPFGCRSCGHHLEKNGFLNEESLGNIKK